MQPRMRRCRTIDISARGARLDGDRPLTPGREFTLYLEPEPGWQIKSTATVVRCHPAFAGERWLTAVSLRLHDSLDKSRLSFWLRRRRLMANKEAAAPRKETR